MDLPKNRMALAIGAGGVVVLIALFAVVWPALTSPEPPLEKAGGGGLSIRVIQPPQAPAKAGGLLDVGLSGAVEAVARGRAVVLPSPRSERPLTPASRPGRSASSQKAPIEDAGPPVELADDQWERGARRRARFEEGQRRRWEEAQLAREARDERAAWDHEQRERRRRDEPDAYDRYDAPANGYGEPRRERW